MKSKRADGRGHWPKSKPRHKDEGDWQAVRLGIQTLLNEHGQPGTLSFRVIAAAIGVDPKAVHRWLRGQRKPSPEHQQMLRTFLREVRQRLKKK